MNHQKVTELSYRVRKEQQVLRLASILCIALFSFLVWREIGKISEILDMITATERDDGATSDLIRLWIMADFSKLLGPMGLLLLHLIAAGASVLAAIYLFSEKKTQLLLAIAEELKNSEPVD
jgi:hypothetical protein